MTLVLYGMTSMARRIGWKDEEKMNLVRGIVIPIVVGVSSLYIVIGSAR